jgi:Ferritin-like
MTGTEGGRRIGRPRIASMGIERREVLAGAGLTMLAGLASGCTSAGAGPSPAFVGHSRVTRHFADPLLELGRLLKEAAEIEHDLMVQYLYAAFSLKPTYAALLGSGAPAADGILDVAIQEMQHLRSVNELLVALRFAPVLTRHDFPEEVDMYPFPFRLEPLSRTSLAKYVYCEAPASAINSRLWSDVTFHSDLQSALGTALRPNHIGSLYATIIKRVEDLVSADPTALADPDKWIGELTHIKDEGEEDHYRFFRTVFMASHEAMAAHRNCWLLDKHDAYYPAWDLPVDPTAYEQYPTTIADPRARSLAWIGNLTYWSMLSLLNMKYRGWVPEAGGSAQQLMRGPLFALAKTLPRYGAGLPFDPLSLGFSAGCNRDCNLAVTARLVAEAEHRARADPHLPTDFEPDTLRMVSEQIERWRRA